jgi:hypothetical protein
MQSSVVVAEVVDLREVSLSALRHDSEAEAIVRKLFPAGSVPVERTVRGFNSYVLTETD